MRVRNYMILHEPCQQDTEQLTSHVFSNNGRNNPEFYPTERGFKMVFLNIVSLLKKIDEISISVSENVFI